MANPKSRIDYWIRKEQSRRYFSIVLYLINGSSVLLAILMNLYDMFLVEEPVFTVQASILICFSLWALCMVFLFAYVDDNAKHNLRLWKEESGQ